MNQNDFKSRTRSQVCSIKLGPILIKCRSVRYNNRFSCMGSVGFETQIIQNTVGCFLDNFYVNKQVVIFRC